MLSLLRRKAPSATWLAGGVPDHGQGDKKVTCFMIHLATLTAEGPASSEPDSKGQGAAVVDGSQAEIHINAQTREPPRLESTEKR